MNKFKRIYIEITNACNMSCSFCPDSNRSLESMSLELFEHILQEIKPYTDHIYLHVKGEPFFHPNFPEIIQLTEKYNLKVNITTNGTLIEEYSDILLNSKSVRQINFSLHSFEDSNNAHNNKQQEYLSKIISFAKAAKNMFISLRLWNITENTGHSSNEFTLEYLEKQFHINKINENFIRGKGIKLADKVYLNFEEVFEWPSLDMPFNSDIGKCQGLNSHIAILSNGVIVPCCLDQDGIINLGNIKEGNLENILKSERARNIYNAFKQNQIVEILCSKCTFRNRFS